MTFLSLFAGIGGFDLGLERAGMRCIGQVEIEPFCQQVLAKHWPHVRRWDDIKTFNPSEFFSDGKTPDLICGGFPCQDISNAGRRVGIGGQRSGLWTEFLRCIRELRPRYVLVENVAALLSRGLDRVLGDLASVGYDAEWHCIPAAAVGAPHLRDRVWIVAYPEPVGRQAGRGKPGAEGEAGQRRGQPAGGAANVPHADGGHRQGGGEQQERKAEGRTAAGGHLPSVSDAQLLRLERAWLRGAIADRVEWLPEPGVCRVAHGIPGGVDRLAALGNAVVPQVVEVIGRAIMRAEQQQKEEAA